MRRAALSAGIQRVRERLLKTKESLYVRRYDSKCLFYQQNTLAACKLGKKPNTNKIAVNLDAVFMRKRAACLRDFPRGRAKGEKAHLTPHRYS